MPRGDIDSMKNYLRAKGGFDKKKNYLRASSGFDKKKNYLEALPLEIREMIFREVLIPAHRDHVVNIREPSSSDIQRQEEEAIFTRCILNQYAPRKGEKKRIEKPLKASRCALMFTCRQFRNEAGQIYFGLNKFKFYQEPDSELLKNFCEDEWILGIIGTPTFLLAPILLTNIRIRLTPGISHYLLSFQNLRHLQIFYEKCIDDYLYSEIARSVRSSKWECFLENHRYLEDIKVDEDSWDFSLMSVYPKLGRLIVEMNTALKDRQAARSIEQLDS